MASFLSKSYFKYIIAAVGVVAVVGGYFLFSNSSGSTNDEIYVPKKINEEFSKYISAYTSGNVSVKSSIRIRFTESIVADDKVGTTEERDVLDFSPSVDGKLKWVDSFTLEFTPEDKFKADQVYEVSLELASLIKVKDELELFEFNFHTIRQDFEVVFNDLVTSAENMKKVSLTGTVNTADIAGIEELETLLQATQEGRELKIEWNHLGETSHEFTITDVDRKVDAGEVLVTWDGNVIGLSLIHI